MSLHFYISEALGQLIIIDSSRFINSGGFPEGSWLIQHSFEQRVWTLAKKGCRNWALAIARKDGAPPALTKVNSSSEKWLLGA